MDTVKQDIAQHDKHINTIRHHINSFVAEGLRKKGFEFSSNEEIAVFVQKHCTCAVSIGRKTKTYYVDNIPFMLHDYNREIRQTTHPNGTITITGVIGHFVFL